MYGLRLYKAEKLCSHTAVGLLFTSGKSEFAYPLRLVWRQTNERTFGAPAQFMITVPKKKLRKAVERVRMRRLIRESYRLNRELLLPALEKSGKRVDMAFIYLSDSLSDYGRVEQRMQKLLASVAEKIADGNPAVSSL